MPKVITVRDLWHLIKNKPWDTPVVLNVGLEQKDIRYLIDDCLIENVHLNAAWNNEMGTVVILNVGKLSPFHRGGQNVYAREVSTNGAGRSTVQSASEKEAIETEDNGQAMEREALRRAEATKRLYNFHLVGRRRSFS